MPKDGDRLIAFGGPLELRIGVVRQLDRCTDGCRKLLEARDEILPVHKKSNDGLGFLHRSRGLNGADGFKASGIGPAGLVSGVQNDP